MAASTWSSFVVSALVRRKPLQPLSGAALRGAAPSIKPSCRGAGASLSPPGHPNAYTKGESVSPMMPTRRLSTTLATLLALLAWLPGVLAAGGGTCPLLAQIVAFEGPDVAPPCCPRNAEPAFREADCCHQPLAVAPTKVSWRAESSATLPPPGPAELASEPFAVPSVPLPAAPPSLPEGIPLYTLHATLLI